MRPSVEALTVEFREILSRKVAAKEAFDEDVLNWWKADGVDVDAILSETKL